MKTNENNLRYFYFIDFLRWVAAMGVLIHHYKAHFNITSENVYNSKIFSLIIDNAIIGSYGVWFFWSVSGFVFANILLNQKTSLFDFSIKRFSRLYPLHFLTLFLITILEFYSFNRFGNFQINSNIYDLYHFILNLLFISEWGFQNGFSFNSVIWSVSIEIPVYFAFFTIILFLKKNLFSYVLFLFILSKLLLHTDLFNYQLKACFFYFLFGAFIYLFCIRFEKYRKFFIIVSIIGIFSWPFLSYLEKVEELVFLKNFLPSTLTLFGSLILFAFFIEKSFSKVGKRISFLGNSSYAIYLMHMPIQVIILILIKSNFFEISLLYSLKSFILFLIFVNVISIVTFKYFENPCRKTINKYFIYD